VRYVKRHTVLGITILALLLVVLACGGEEPADTAVATPTPSGSGAVATPTPSAEATPTPVVITAPEVVTGEGPVYGGLIKVGNRRDPDVSDPFEYSSITYQYSQNNLHAQLVKPAHPDNTTPAPDIAESWEVSEDFGTYTFHLREDAKWHDGTPITAYDIEYTLLRGANPPDGLLSLQQPRFTQITNIEIPDDHTIILTIETPKTGFLSDMMVANIRYAHPKHLFDGNEPIRPEDVGYVSSGAFKFKRYKRGNVFEVEKFEDYFGKDAAGNQMPYLDGVQHIITYDASTHFALFRVGRLDVSARGAFWYLSPDHIEILEREMGDEFKYYQFPSFNWTVYFNPTLEAIQDVRVRKAIQLWMNRKDAQAVIDNGLAITSGFFVPSSPHSVIDWATEPGWNQDTKDADQETAKQLMVDAGYADGFDFTLLARDLWVVPGEFVVSTLTGLNINGVLDVVDQPTRTERLTTSRFEADVNVTTGLTDDDMYRIFHSSAAIGVMRGWKEAGLPQADWIDAKVEEMVASFDPVERATLAQEIERYIYLEEYLVMPLSLTVSVVGMRDYVHGTLAPSINQSVNTEMSTVWMDPH